MGLKWFREWRQRDQRREEAYLLALNAIKDVAISAAEAQEATARALTLVIEQQMNITTGEAGSLRDDGDTFRLNRVLDHLSRGDENARKALLAQATLNELDFS